MTAPVLLLGFNRPDRLVDLVESLRRSAPPMVRLAVDGPRPNRPSEEELVRQCVAVAQRIDWTHDVEVLQRETNQGLERAIPEAVSWVLDSHESVIVIEDDVTIGDQFVEYAEAMLARFADDESIMHVSGYNVVPNNVLTRPYDAIRISRIPESFAWATWKRAWVNYDSSLQWANACTVRELREITGTRLAAVRWRQNFQLANKHLISSWAYRWAASMWSQGGWCISPQRNLVTYRGYSDGTHTRRKAKWDELPIERIDLEKQQTEVQFDLQSEQYLHTKIFSASPLGVALGPLEKIAIQMLKSRHRPSESDGHTRY